MQKREIAIYLLVAASSLFLMSYVVHMMIGGLVTEETQINITIGVLVFWTLGLTALGWDIAKKRRGK